MTISRRLLVLMQIGVVAPLIVAVLAFYVMRGVYDDASYANFNTVPSLNRLNQIQDRVMSLQLRLYERMRTNDPSEINRIDIEIARGVGIVQQQFHGYEALLSDAEDLRLFEREKSLMEEFERAVRLSLRSLEGQQERRVEFSELAQKGKVLDTALEQHLAYNQALGEQAAVRAAHEMKIATWITAAIALVAALCVGGISLRTRRRLLDQIEHANSMAARIASGDLSAGAHKGLLGGDEMGRLLQSLETMKGRLADIRAELEEHQDKLQGTVTERTAQLEAALSAATAATEAKSAFLANMSHEIRTPMNAIIGMADLALATQLTTRQKNYVSKIKSASTNLLGIINDILDFSKIEAGKLNMERTPFVLDDVFDRLAEVMAFRAEDLGIEFYIEIQDEGSLLEGDPMRLGQVLMNLTSNALKFSTRGAVVVRAERVGEAEGCAEFHFSVRDDGIGITSAQLEHLFLPFAQADSTTTRRYGGTGLGLSISRQLVELMQGRIWAESSPGKGSTFHFTARFPLLGKDRRLIGRDLAQQLGDRARLPVLVIDDNPVARAVAEGLLQKLGLRSESAVSGGDALARIDAEAASDFLLFLIDWRMPGGDGLELAKRIRSIYASRMRRSPPVVLMTAFSHDKELDQVSNDMDGVISKPVNVRALKATLSSCLGLRPSLPKIERRRTEEDPWARFRGMDILVVEDVELNREVIGELLANVGVSVRFSEDGEKALDSIAQQRPDLVLMDIQMPVMDGYMATRTLRGSPNYRDLPIIALTANALIEEQEKCREAGMNAHVSKPIQMDDLYEKMMRCIPNPPNSPRQKLGGVSALNTENTDSLPTFPGIELSAGLSLLKSLPTLMRILKQFRDNQGVEFSGSFEAALAHGDWDTQVRLAHSLKGVALTLGAFPLGEAASELELAAKARNMELRDQVYINVLEHLITVVEGLESLDTLLVEYSTDEAGFIRG